MIFNLIPEQGLWKQCCTSVNEPSHAFPLPCGSGELHERLRVCAPSPHDDEHGDHVSQFDQPPFTVEIRKHLFTSQYFTKYTQLIEN